MSIRMICMYPHRGFQSHAVQSALAPQPTFLEKEQWMNITDISRNDAFQTIEGTNKSILPPNIHGVLGNVKHIQQHFFFPLCETVMTAKKMPDKYFQQHQCVPLESNRPAEYHQKWIGLGCPYMIKASHFTSIQPKKIAEILPFREIAIPEYDRMILDRRPDPLLKSEYQRLMQ